MVLLKSFSKQVNSPLSICSIIKISINIITPVPHSPFLHHIHMYPSISSHLSHHQLSSILFTCTHQYQHNSSTHTFPLYCSLVPIKIITPASPFPFLHTVHLCPSTYSRLSHPHLPSILFTCTSQYDQYSLTSSQQSYPYPIFTNNLNSSASSHLSHCYP